jgi:hypothetical protein
MGMRSKVCSAQYTAMADDEVHDEEVASDEEGSEDEVEGQFHFGQRPVMRRCLSDADVSKILSALVGLLSLRSLAESTVKNCVKTVPLELSLISARSFCSAIICATGHAGFVGKYFSTDLDLPTEMRRVAVVTRMYCEYATTVAEQRDTFNAVLAMCKTEEGKMIVDILASMKSNQMNRAASAATALGAAARFAKVAPRGMPQQSDDELFPVPVAQAPSAPADPARKRTKRAVSPPVPATTPEPVTEEGGI